MVTADGFVKVLDFGLAKLRAESGDREQWFDSASAHLAGVALAADRARCRPRHGWLHVARAGARPRRWTTAPTSSRSGRSSTRWPRAPGVPPGDAGPDDRRHHRGPPRSRSPSCARSCRRRCAWVIERMPREGPRRALRLDPRPRPRAARAARAPGRGRHLRGVGLAPSGATAPTAASPAGGGHGARRRGRPQRWRVARSARAREARGGAEASSATGGEDASRSSPSVRSAPRRTTRPSPRASSSCSPPASRSSRAPRARSGSSLRATCCARASPAPTGRSQRSGVNLVVTRQRPARRGAARPDRRAGGRAPEPHAAGGDGREPGRARGRGRAHARARARRAEESTLRASATGVAEAATLAAQAMGYTPYADGRTALERYDQSQSLERAIDLFQQALERDPALRPRPHRPRRGLLAALPRHPPARVRAARAAARGARHRARRPERGPMGRPRHDRRRHRQRRGRPRRLQERPRP